jgi:hypothetical protein
MTRFEIKDLLQGFIDDGKLMTKKSVGTDYATIKRRLAKGDLLVTYYEEIVATDEDARKRFAELVKEGRVMDLLQVQNKTGLITKYAVDKACAEGEMLKFAGFGKSKPLYID